MLNKLLSLSLGNIWEKTVFDGELWMTKNRLLAWYMCVSKNSEIQEFDGDDHQNSIALLNTCSKSMYLVFIPSQE